MLVVQVLCGSVATKVVALNSSSKAANWLCLTHFMFDIYTKFSL